MADELLFMKRYQGSDDEDSIDSIKDGEDEKYPSNILDNLNYEPNKKKQRTKFFEITDEEINEVTEKKLNDKNYDLKSVNTFSKKKQSDLTGILKDKSLSEENVKLKNEKKTKNKSKSLKNEDHVKLEEEDKTSKEINNFKNEIENDEGNFCTIGQVKDKNVEKIKPILPKWLSNPSIIGIDLKEHKIPISDVSYLDDVSKKNLQEAGINFLFPVQSAVIPWLLQNNQQYLSRRPSDLCVSAPTGSGKTLAFVLPIIQSLRNRTVTAVRALIVLPVSELAIQVYKVFEMFVRNTDLKVTLLTGQKSFVLEQNSLVKQGVRRTISLVDIIVTTPGRILDHISRTKGFCLEHLRFLVIDEADRMMDDVQKGWLKQIENAVYNNSNSLSCLCFAPAGKRSPFEPSTACHFGYVNEPLQKLLYSATLSHDPEKLHTLFLYKPKLFTTESKSEGWIGKCTIPENLSLFYTVCKDDTKPLVLCHLIKERQFKKVLCFMDSVERAQRLHFILEEMGFLRVREISSINRPVQRKIILEQFSAGKLDLLVCSDLVARGMDIEGVDCVISYDTPLPIKKYVHRIGRTARAGNKGTAVTLLTESESKSFKKVLTSSGMPVPEQIDIAIKDLEIYVDPFKKALNIVDSKIRKMKSNTRNQLKEDGKKN
ncbi:ATP-dependent RNA helicase DDX51 [Caerostris darwini]|uniref:ATP-dependent RNA helicase n=1 Tax=Caerostris darwini TaxID=1538125 RepID=A0AAV4MCX8_9ARAC|nr:ATP-dependent RNA helicase DDX51 [Caerostris darwini]